MSFYCRFLQLSSPYLIPKWTTYFADRLENKTKTHKSIKNAQCDLPYNIKILYVNSGFRTGLILICFFISVFPLLF